MGHELRITPSGRIVVRETGRADELAAVDAGAETAVRALASSQPQGLLTLATEAAGSALPPALAFWRDFAARYLTGLCHTPAPAGRQIEAVEPPGAAELTEMLLGAPPMQGAEYLSVGVLAAIWDDLDRWLRGQVERQADGLAGFLRRRAPQWHQVGRVCFHLAENSRNPLFPFAFLATYIPGLSRTAGVRYQPLGKALEQYAGARNNKALVRLLSPVQRASEQSPFIRALVDSGDIFHPLTWRPQEAYQFLQEVPLYEASGLLVRLPDWWRKRPRPQVGITIGQKRRSVLGADALLDFNVTLALGDQTLTKEEWQELLAGDDGLVLLKGQWVEVDRAQLSAALEHWQKVQRAARGGSLSFIEGMRLLAGAPADLEAGAGAAEQVAEWSFVHAGQWLGQVLDQLRNPQRDGETNPGKSLRTALRHYQQTGLDWLWLMTQLGLGACLADDMGLGKTIQVLALLLVLKQRQQATPRSQTARRPALLVMPASLLANWKAEMARFAPSLTAAFIHASETSKDVLARFARSPAKSLRGFDVALTSYGMLQRQKWLLEVPWQLVILDEAQAIKNPAARQTRAVKQLRARARVALTGTPVENRLGDLWSLFDFLCPGLLGSAATFKRFVKTLDERQRDRYAPLRNLVQPYILRRLKTDKTIIADLPDKAEVTAYCRLSKRQTALYQKSVAEMAEVLEDAEGMKRRGLVLSYLMRFKQICNHPSQFLGDGQYRPADSGKFDRLAEICQEIAARQEKVLVFTQFREMTEPLGAHLADLFERPGLVLHGGTPVRQRRGLIDHFQREDGPPFFVLSLKAGGTGLNLTAAAHVVHFDRWWNPAVENQATDRAFRIGQKRNVLVHKFVCRGTIEERIDRMIEDKKALAADLLAGGAEKLLTEMSDQQLLQIVALDVDKATA